MCFEEETMTTTTLISVKAPQRGRRTLSASAAYAVAAFTVGLTQFASVVPSPLYHSYAALWGFSATTLTLIYATYAAGILAVLLLAGRVSDEVGRRPVLLAALALLAVAAVVFSAADGAAWLFAARFLQGLGVGAALGTASAAVLDLNPRRDASSVGIVTAASASLGIALGLLTSAVAVQYGPAPLELPYVVLLGLIAVAMVGVWLMPETVETRERFRLTVAWPHVPSSLRRPFALASLAAIAAWSVGGLYFSLGPRLGAHVFGTTNVLVGLSGIIVLSFVAPVAQVAFGRIPAWLSMAAGSVALAVATLTVVLATSAQLSGLYIAGSALGGAAWGLTFLGGLRSLAAVIPAEHRAGVYSAYYVASYGALSVPAVAAGIAADHFGLLPTFRVFGAVVAALALVVAVVAWRTRPRAATVVRVDFDSAGARRAA
jgi:MFS family permease